MRLWFHAVLALVVGTACYALWRLHESKYPAWSEQVRLSDGRVVVVRQQHDVHERGGTVRHWMTIDLPELGGRHEWSAQLMPQRVDVHDGKVYAYGLPRGPEQLERYHYPKFFMVAFMWSGKDFVRIPFMRVPAPLRERENVLRCVPAQRRQFVTLEQKLAQPCPPLGQQGELGSELDLTAYKRAGDTMAASGKWILRSE
jgi:hypothetical protein